MYGYGALALKAGNVAREACVDVLPTLLDAIRSEGARRKDNLVVFDNTVAAYFKISKVYFPTADWLPTAIGFLPVQTDALEVSCHKPAAV